MPQSFVGDEEKGLVPDDRAAKIAAKKIALEWRRMTRRELEEVAGIQRVIAEEFEQLAMKSVGTGASCDVNDGAGALPIFGAERRIIDLELLHTADRWLDVNRIV